MTKIYLVRHGQAAAGWNQDLDPPLSEKGQQQAEQVSDSLVRLIPNIDETQCISSPIKRAHETAGYFSRKQNKAINIEARVAEIPSPTNELNERMPWLMQVMKSQWSVLSPELNQWRQDCIDYVLSLEQDSVIFSHYIAINVLIGHCNQDDRVISYNPDNCSIHQFEITDSEKGRELSIVELGTQAKTKIN